MVENINDLKLDRPTNHVLIAINKIFHGLDWKNRHCSNFTDRLFVKHCHCERSEAIFSLPGDCFVAPLLAMT